MRALALSRPYAREMSAARVGDEVLRRTLRSMRVFASTAARCLERAAARSSSTPLRARGRRGVGLDHGGARDQLQRNPLALTTSLPPPCRVSRSRRFERWRARRRGPRLDERIERHRRTSRAACPPDYCAYFSRLDAVTARGAAETTSRSVDPRRRSTRDVYYAELPGIFTGPSRPRRSTGDGSRQSPLGHTALSIQAARSTRARSTSNAGRGTEYRRARGS